MNKNTTEQGIGEFLLPKTRLQKNRKKCYVREKRLANLLKKILELEPSFWSKKRVGNLYWKYMENYGVSLQINY